MGCPPKAQGRSGCAEQIQLQEVPGYSRHEPVEVQAQKFPTSQGRPWVEGRGGAGGAWRSRSCRPVEDRRTGGPGEQGLQGGVRKEKKQCWAVAGRGHLMERFVSRSFWQRPFPPCCKHPDGLKTGNCPLTYVGIGHAEHHARSRLAAVPVSLPWPEAVLSSLDQGAKLLPQMV